MMITPAELAALCEVMKAHRVLVLKHDGLEIHVSIAAVAVAPAKPVPRPNEDDLLYAATEGMPDETA